MAPSPALEEYQIGWVCALPIEAAAAQEMLDERFGLLEEQDNADTNIYTLGRVGKHLVVIACLGGQYGTTSATIVVNNMMRTFSKSLRVGLMVGIGGGIPSATNDIRLGDIVISYPTGTSSGVIQHDMGKVGEDGKFTRTGSLNSPPRLLLVAVDSMRATAFREDPVFPSYIQQAVQRNTRTQQNFSQPNPQYDRLFQIQYEHPSAAASCDSCLTEWEVTRYERKDKEPQLHYGIIASGNSVIKNGKVREQLQVDTGALCFEMEAAGLMLDFPCIVIRGICDYADSHKNKQWQGYAALVAAAYAKELLGYVPRGQVSQQSLVADICKTITGELKGLSKSMDLITQKLDLGRLHIAKGAAFDSYENQLDECLPGTRIELLHQVKEWAESSHGKCIFWLNGMAGTGKSTISRTVASYLKEKRLLGASFFFKRGEADQGNAKSLFPTLIEQLAISIPQLIPDIQKAIYDDPNISEKVLREQFEKLILQPMLGIKRSQAGNQAAAMVIVIVIDALDECDREDDIRVILQLLPLVQKLNSVRLRFFLTSRPELPVRLGFKEIGNEDHQDLDLHEIPPREIEYDISLFLKNRLSKIRRERSLSSDWPGDENIQILVARAVPLFISAATLYRFIGDVKWNPESRLRAILTDQATYVSKMDSTYLPILNQLLTGQDEYESKDLVQDFKAIVGVIILLATPLSINALAQLLNMNTYDISSRLDTLHSVLRIPNNPNDPVRLLHLSFRDYLLDSKKKNSLFWIDKKDIHHRLTDQCLQIMRRSLRKNICKLPSEGTQRMEVDKYTINQYLPPELQYSCRYWAHHLAQSKDPVAEMDNAFSFLQTYFLYWAEVMSILGILSEVIEITNILQLVIQHSEISEFLYDMKRFIVKNMQIADTAPLQLYCSGLVFAPRTAIIRREFEGELPSWIHRLPEVEETWSAELQTLEGHTVSVHSVAFSPDSRLLASSSDDQTIKLWDTTTGALQQTLQGHKGPAHSVAFSPDSRLLASGSNDSTIKLWDTTTGVGQQTLQGHSGAVKSVAFSPDGRLLASGSDDTILPDGQRLMPGSVDSTIKLWDPTTGALQQTIEGHKGQVLSMAFSPDGRLLASGSFYATIMIWHTITGALQQTVRLHLGPALSVAFSPDGQLLAAGSFYQIELWDTTTGTLQQTLQRRSGAAHSVAFSLDGQLLASGSHDSTIRLWDTTTGALQHTLQGHSGAVFSVAFSLDGRLLASGSHDQTIKLWDTTRLLESGSNDTTTGALQQTLQSHTGPVLSMAFSLDGRLLASGSNDSTINFWDTTTGALALQQTLQGHIFHGHTGQIQTVAFSGQLLVLGSLSDHQLQRMVFSADGRLLSPDHYASTIKFWDLTTRALQQTIEGRPSEVRSVAFSPSSYPLAIGFDGSTIKLWDTTTGALTLQQTLQDHSLSQIRTLVFSPDGRLLAAGSFNGYQGQVRSVAFSPNSQLLAIGFDDSTIKLWDITTGALALQQILQGHTGPVRSVAFSPDGPLLASSSDDQTIKLWDSTTGALQQTLTVQGVVTYLDFSGNGLYLITNLGSLGLQPCYHNNTSNSPPIRVFILERQWITLEGKKVLWLPPEYRPMSSADKDGILALGHASGRVSFIGFCL